ncbi:MAG: hypothetical protein IKB64_08900 [Paludibacteraceae bacterium]|nr:hypothetical protein [Paludibacteraceae bacterium]
MFTYQREALALFVSINRAIPGPQNVKRAIMLSFTLFLCHYLINLNLKPMSQWDITDTNIMKKSLLLFTLLVSSFCLSAKEKVEDVEIIEGNMSFFLESESYSKVNLDLSDCYIVEMKDNGDIKKVIGTVDSLNTLPEGHNDQIELKEFYHHFLSYISNYSYLKMNNIKYKKITKIIITKPEREEYEAADAKEKKKFEKRYNIVSDSLAKYDITFKIDSVDVGYFAPGILGAGGGAKAKGSVEVKNLESGNIVCKLKINYLKGLWGPAIDHQRFGQLSFAILKEMYDLATAKKK